MREKTTRVSEGEATGRADRAAGRVRPEGWPDRWARAGRERGEREKFLIKILKAKIELKKRVFLEKAFQHPIKSRKNKLNFYKNNFS
jgi:hypothetical protein